MEIVENKKEETNDGCGGLNPNPNPNPGLILMNPFKHQVDGFINSEILMMFSDENPNACVIM